MNMNCEQYKEAIAADPSASFGDGATHVAGCNSCAIFRVELQALDGRIARALAIVVPELKIPELPPVGDGNIVSMPVGRKTRRLAPWLAIAASFALAAIIGVQSVGNAPDSEYSLADDILDHIGHEPAALKVTNVPVSDEEFSRVVNPSVGSMDRNVGLISYARTCVIHGKTVPHLVIQGREGPVTLLLLPDEMVERAQTIDRNRVNGVILPVGHGSIALIGERKENIGEIERKVVDSVEWSI